MDADPELRRGGEVVGTGGTEATPPECDLLRLMPRSYNLIKEC